MDSRNVAAGSYGETTGPPPVGVPTSAPPSKGKGRASDVSMEEDDTDDNETGEEEDPEEEEIDEEDMEEDDTPEILPRGARRTRAQVNYASEEAQKKAGLDTHGAEAEEDDDDDDEYHHAAGEDEDE